jgi:outer membrane protein TolC
VSAIPAVAVGAGFTKNEDSTSYIGAGNLSASLSISSSTFGSIRQARQNYEAGLINHESAVRDVELSVRKAFYSIVYEREYITYLGSLVDTAERQYDMTLKNQQAGLVPRLDALSAKVNLENSRLALEMAENSYRNSVSAFMQAVGLQGSEPVSFAGSLEGTFTAVLSEDSKYPENSVAYLSLAKKLEIAKSTKDFAIANVWAPSVSLSVTSRTASIGMDSAPVLMAPSITSAVTFQVSEFLPWSSANESALSAGDAVRDIEVQIDALRKSDSAKKESLSRDIGSLKKTLEARRLTVSLAEESYRLTEVAFNAGTKDFLALKSAGNALQEARMGMLKESFSLISSALDLEYVCGVPFGTFWRVQ